MLDKCWRFLFEELDFSGKRVAVRISEDTEIIDIAMTCLRHACAHARGFRWAARRGAGANVNDGFIRDEGSLIFVSAPLIFSPEIASKRLECAFIRLFQ